MSEFLIASGAVAVVVALLYAFDRRLALLAQRRELVRLASVARIQAHTPTLYPRPMVSDDEYITPLGAA